jgi:hypothetical protein
MWWRISLLAAAWVAWAGPVEFGLEEYRRALQERGLKPELYRVRTELNAEPPETYRIAPGLITGGDLRGLMYGLLDAAEQIRRRGRVWAAHGRPATPIRGIRWFLHNRELEEEWFYSKQHWLDLFSFLARCRFNRFNLVYAHQTNYQAPPYPFWLALDDYPEIRAPGLAALEQQRHLEMLRFISQAAADHGIDFTLGIWQHNVQANQMPTVVGLTPKNIGPYSYAALRRILAECPAIRSVQMRTNVESGIPREDQVGFYRDWVFRALREAGRRVTLDLRAWALAQGMIEAAHSVGVPLRVSTKYWAEHLGRPYQPAETFPGYSYLDLVRKPRHYEFFWEVWALGSHRLLVWGDPEYVRRAVPTFTLSGTAGFEIDPPLAQKGFGNRPGKWGVFTPAHRDKIWWKWEFERYWLFYLLWGRLSYDPKTAETVWLDEFQRRFGAAARDALEVYRAASGVLNEIVAVHMADPNMYIWPEVNPGGLIDAYIEVRPSDWRFVATIPEAVENRLKGVPSAKQTPLETAARLRQMATRIEQGIANVRARGVPSREWVATEPDFRVLAHLARYHAHKQVAAYELAWHYRVGDGAALKRARSELEAAQSVWEDLVRLTDGLYPEEMAFGPQDIGHWKDRLPYVRHDVQTVAERERVWEELGRFDFGFDFGAEPQAPATGATLPAGSLPVAAHGGAEVPSGGAGDGVLGGTRVRLGRWRRAEGSCAAVDAVRGDPFRGKGSPSPACQCFVRGLAGRARRTDLSRPHGRRAIPGSRIDAGGPRVGAAAGGARGTPRRGLPRGPMAGERPCGLAGPSRACAHAAGGAQTGAATDGLSRPATDGYGRAGAETNAADLAGCGLVCNPAVLSSAESTCEVQGLGGQRGAAGIRDSGRRGRGGLGSDVLLRDPCPRGRLVLPRSANRDPVYRGSRSDRGSGAGGGYREFCVGKREKICAIKRVPRHTKGREVSDAHFSPRADDSARQASDSRGRAEYSQAGSLPLPVLRAGRFHQFRELPCHDRGFCDSAGAGRQERASQPRNGVPAMQFDQGPACVQEFRGSQGLRLATAGRAAQGMGSAHGPAEGAQSSSAERGLIVLSAYRTLVSPQSPAVA